RAEDVLDIDELVPQRVAAEPTSHLQVDLDALKGSEVGRGVAAAAPAVEVVFAVAADENVVAATAIQEVVAAETDQGAATARPVKAVRLVVAEDDVVVVGANDVFDVDQRVSLRVAILPGPQLQADIDVVGRVAVIGGVDVASAVEVIGAGAAPEEVAADAPE